MSRFPSASHLVSWAGLCPKLEESAGKHKSTRIKQGDHWLKTTLIQASWAGVRCKSGYLPSRFRRLRVHRGGKKAVVANAAFILKAIWNMLTKGEDFKDLGESYFEGQNPEKHVARLKGQLERLGKTVVLSDAV